jgi:spermidine synthase
MLKLSSFFSNTGKIIYKTHSPISGEIIVREGEWGLDLVVQGFTYTTNLVRQRPNYWEYCVKYSSIQSSSDVLILGLGGGEMIKKINDLSYFGGRVDTVELDPIIIDVYTKYFDSKPKFKVNIIEDDAYKYILSNVKKYDLIICDVYLHGEYPPHFLEDNFLHNVKKSLSKHGQYVSNRAFIVNVNSSLNEYSKLLKNYFKTVYYKNVADKSYQSCNYVFYANN